MTTLTSPSERWRRVFENLDGWLVLAVAHWFLVAGLVDSDDALHLIDQSRCYNFEHYFFNASMTCISTVFAHVWLTAGAIARRHALHQAGAHGGVGYAARLAAAEAEARVLSKGEWAHVGLVAFDFFFAAFFVFTAEFTVFRQMKFGLIPGAILAAVAKLVLGPARAAVLRKQRTNSVAFAGAALRGSLAVLMVQAVVLARCAHIHSHSFCGQFCRSRVRTFF